MTDSVMLSPIINSPCHQPRVQSMSTIGGSPVRSRSGERRPCSAGAKRGLAVARSQPRPFSGSNGALAETENASLGFDQ
jgi:hypothetical protein